MMPHFANPWMLLLLALLPVLVWRHFRRIQQGDGSLKFASTVALEGVRPSWTVRVRNTLVVFELLAFALAVVALARPQLGIEEEEMLSDGVDIVIALDASGSMAAEDFEPRNRLHVAKLVARRFVESLRHDRVGLVVFAGKSYTRCPPTLDYGVLLTVLDDVQLGTIEDGTAIGSGLATALNRLRESKAKSRVIILATDGINNRGEIQPLDAARIAKALGVRIYTVGIGTRGTARFPVNDPTYGRIYMDLPVEIDEDSLTRIASMTGGKYERATDGSSLERIFMDIAKLEKTKIRVRTYTHYNERYGVWLLASVVLVSLTALAGSTRFGKLP
jgi:Ca-activated chloride channel homolog